MSRKNKAPKEHKEPAQAKPFDAEVKKAISIFLVFLLIFCVGNFVGSLNSKQVAAENDVTSAEPATTAAPQTTASQATTADTAPVTSDTQQSSQDASSQPADPSASTSDNAAASTGTPQTKAEILKLYTDSANKVKTSATKVVRNYQDLQNVPEELQLPSALQSVGNGLLNQFLKKDETPLELAGADIKAQFPVQGQDYVCNATEADIADATCTDDGANYKVVLKFNTCTDPADGTACAGAFNTIRTQDVYDNVPSGLIQNFSATYHDAQIEATIDKATGNMIAATYTLPITLSVTAKVIVTLDAQVGMRFIDDYTITY